MPTDITTQPEFSKLMSLLNNTRVQTQNPALWQFLSQFVGFTKQFQGVTGDQVDGIIEELEKVTDVSDATVLTDTDETDTFPNSRQLIAGTNITFDTTVANELTISSTGGGAGGDDEVFVGPDDPGPGYEVWYDTDDTSIVVSLRRQATLVIDGAGSVITTGYKGSLSLPINGTFKKWRILADVSGSIVIDVWKDTYANYPPTAADTITASAKPTLSSDVKAESSTLTGWTTAFTEGDIIGFNVDSVSTVTKVTLHLEFE
jgi:hypothetical protein